MINFNRFVVALLFLTACAPFPDLPEDDADAKADFPVLLSTPEIEKLGSDTDVTAQAVELEAARKALLSDAEGLKGPVLSHPERTFLQGAHDQ